MAKAPRVPGSSAAPATTAQPLPQTPAPAMPDDTPNSVDVDPEKITQPTLTRQGWIVPVEKKKG
jgi:hypothetical protein